MVMGKIEIILHMLLVLFDCIRRGIESPVTPPVLPEPHHPVIQRLFQMLADIGLLQYQIRKPPFHL